MCRCGFSRRLDDDTRLVGGSPKCSGVCSGAFRAGHTLFTMTIRERLNEKREEVLRVAGRHGARNVRLIGSVARGDATADSDLDLLVELERGRSLLDHAALMIELGTLLGCKVDVATEQGLRPRVRERVLAEAVAL